MRRQNKKGKRQAAKIRRTKAKEGWARKKERLKNRNDMLSRAFSQFIEWVQAEPKLPSFKEALESALNKPTPFEKDIPMEDPPR